MKDDDVVKRMKEASSKSETVCDLCGKKIRMSVCSEDEDDSIELGVRMHGDREEDTIGFYCMDCIPKVVPKK